MSLIKAKNNRFINEIFIIFWHNTLWIGVFLRKGLRVSKTAEFIKLLSVLLLCVLILGMVGYFIPSIAALSALPENPVPVTSTIPTPNSTPIPYAVNLANSIQTTLEKITGPDTIKAAVHVEIQQQQETIKTDLILPDTAVVKEIVTTPTTPDHQTPTEKTVYDFSFETHTRQNTMDFIKHQSITVLIDGILVKDKGSVIYQPRSGTEIETYTSLIKSLSGFNADRGDRIEVVNVPFATPKINTIFGFNQVIFVQSVLLALFFILCVLVLVRFILPLIYILIQPTPVTYAPLPLQNTPSEQIIGSVPLSKSQLIRQLFIQTPDSALLLLKQWLYQQNTPQNALSGIQKAAILLLALGEETIKSIFLKLPSEAVCEISRTMASLGTIQSETVQAVFDSFLAMQTGASDLNASPAYVNQVLSTTLPQEKAADLLKEINSPVSGKTVWEKLEKTDPVLLAQSLITEYPQTIAVILYHLSNEQAGAILNQFPESLTMDVLMRLTALQTIDTETLDQVEKGLSQQLQNLFSDKSPKSGKEKASDIISLMEKKTDILNTLFERSPDMARQISAGVLSFEDIVRWNDMSIRTLLEKADRTTVVYALKGASDQLKNAFSRNMSPAVWGSILKETNKLTAVKLKDIDTAQHALVKLAQDLTQQKKITPTPYGAV